MGVQATIRKLLILFTLYGGILRSSANPLVGENVQPAKANEFPFVVSLGRFAPSVRSERYLNHFCGGSLITQRHVLTAAHCFESENQADVTVTIGSVNLNDGKLYTIKSWITYEKWAMDNNILSKFDSNDIAVVTLSKDVDNIVPGVRSNLPEVKIFEEQVIAVGWGEFVNDSRPQFLQKASLHVLNPKQCKRYALKLFGTEKAIPHNHYCTAATPPVVTSCGDSGGPLILKDTKEIVGVNEGTCDVENAHKNPHAMSIHVKVINFKEFIDDVSKI